MNKKIICLLVSCILCMSVCVFSVSAEDEMEDILGLLNELKIMQGDGDGNFRLDDTVTRAEFTKVAVAASSFRNSVPSGISVSPFPDVSYKHWAAPFVKVALSNKIVSGYTDGTFKPDKTVTYEEGITILLQLLGYTVEDFGASWPSGQIGLAENIELTENVNGFKGQELTRRQVAFLAYNLLNMRPKGGNNNYISVFEWSSVSDTTLVSVGSGDNTVLTSDGSYKADEDFKSSSIGCEGTLFINKAGKAQYFVVDESEAVGERYIVYSVLNDAVITYDNGSLSQLNLTSDTTTYVDSSKTTYSAAKSKLSIGDVVYVKRDNSGKIDYISVETREMEGPVRVIKDDTWHTKLGVDSLSGITVMRDSTKVNFSDLETNDIAYYSRELNMIFAYTKKVTGIYENASPNRDTPSSVTISGVVYEIESVNAYNKLSSSGSFQYGDTVTILLGKDGAVADVATASSAGTATIYGYLTATSVTERDISGDGNISTVYTASIVGADGKASSYTVAKDYSSLINKVVKITFANGSGTVSSVSSPSSVNGVVDSDNYTLGSLKLSKNINILDVASDTSEGYTLYKKIYLPRLDDINISSGDVLYYEKNSSDEVETLILKGVTGDMYSYGIVTSSPSDNTGLGNFGYRIGSQTGMWNQTKKIYTMSLGMPTTGAGVRFAAKTNADGSILSVMNGEVMYKISTIKEINSVYLISDDNVKHLISDSVTVYKKNAANDFMLISLDDVIGDSSLNLRAYYDAPSSEGGRVRVIIAE